LKLKPRVGFYAVYEPAEEGWQDWETQSTLLCQCMRRRGMEVVEAPEAVRDLASCQRVAEYFRRRSLDVLHVLVVTWSCDHYSYLIQQANPLPLIIRSIPGIRSGSIVGAQQLASVLADLGLEHRLLYGPLECKPPLAEAFNFAAACALRSRLKHAAFAMLGRRTPGMTPIAVDELEIMRIFGARLVHFGMDELDELATQVSDVDAEGEWARVSAGASAISCSNAAGVDAMRTYLALRRLAQREKLAGLAVGSYPACQGSACLPIALLNEEGIVAGCEGDMNATLLMYILSQLSDYPVHFGEMLEVDEQQNTILSSHCGAAAPSLASDAGYTLCPVRLAHTGVCIRFRARTGLITYANLVGRHGTYRLCAFEGEAIPTEMVFEGNPLRLHLSPSFRGVWNAVAEHGFGHHWMASYAHVLPVLVEFCRLTGIQGVFPV
jgi:L-fucose isomerase-like protein